MATDDVDDDDDDDGDANDDDGDDDASFSLVEAPRLGNVYSCTKSDGNQPSCKEPPGVRLVEGSLRRRMRPLDQP